MLWCKKDLLIALHYAWRETERIERDREDRERERERERERGLPLSISECSQQRSSKACGQQVKHVSRHLG